MSKTTNFVAALGAFGALAYLLNPLPPDAPSAHRIASAGQPANSPMAAVSQPAVPGDTSASVAQPPRQDATVRLVQQIQTELLRLGCYAGAVDGHWTVETQQAMHILGERVRVLRPVETPDYIMLALARSQPSHVCTARDRATAAARFPAKMVPSAARGVAAAPVQHRADRAEKTPDASRARVTRRADGRNAPSDIRTAERAVPDPENDDTPLRLRRDQDALDGSRMALGAASVDPLRTGIDPRDPTAPAILRGPARAGPLGASVAELAPPRVGRRVEREERPTTRPRSDWKRTLFNKLRENGP